jgi:hypothetical protein
MVGVGDKLLEVMRHGVVLALVFLQFLLEFAKRMVFVLLGDSKQEFVLEQDA